ncbi:hypothetical protein BZA05DRAFT_197777 [Tricharina praecox]|uniref:uncharacterized protein n=1 Tax=Tricharina praecox TaxID=43433 RepID=UPI00221F2B1D|nr:uncharacterized protein BZA05DRAFT_197777 [Tricharina praecox]KAI5856310.1 hypothetical protein BZA05DRAFT_197777 [Tricharina praecox]
MCPDFLVTIIGPIFFFLSVFFLLFFSSSFHFIRFGECGRGGGKAGVLLFSFLHTFFCPLLCTAIIKYSTLPTLHYTTKGLHGTNTHTHTHTHTHKNCISIRIHITHTHTYTHY